MSDKDRFGCSLFQTDRDVHETSFFQHQSDKLGRRDWLWPKWSTCLSVVCGTVTLNMYLVTNWHTDASSHHHHRYQHHCHHHCHNAIIIIRALAESHGHCWEGICVCLIDESVIVQQHIHLLQQQYMTEIYIGIACIRTPLLWPHCACAFWPNYVRWDFTLRMCATFIVNKIHGTFSAEEVT